MGFASGGISFRRYLVSGPGPQTMEEVSYDSIREQVFGTGALMPDGIEVGWIAPSHLFDTVIDEGKVEVGRFLHLVMRLDRTAAPAAVIRSYRQIEEAAALEASGKEKLSADERRLAKDAAESRARKEAQSGRYRRISTHSVLFDVEHQVVYLGSLGNTGHDRLLKLFSDTFKSTLSPLDVTELADRITQETGKHRSLEDATPFHLINSPAGGGGGSSFDGADRSFLGKEFLSWLWYLTDNGDGFVEPRQSGRSTLPTQVAVLFDRIIQLDCDFELSGRDILYSEQPTTSPEARAGLRMGKQPTRAGLTLAADGEQFSMVFDAQKMQVSGLKLPEIDEPDALVCLEERCLMMARCSAILDGLFGCFVSERFGEKHGQLANQMREWVQTGRPAPQMVETDEAESNPLRIAR